MTDFQVASERNPLYRGIRHGPGRRGCGVSGTTVTVDIARDTRIYHIPGR